MGIKELASLIGRHSSCISRFKGMGVINDYPPGYKQMNAEELADYIAECKELIKAHCDSTEERRTAGIVKAAKIRKETRFQYELPDYLKRAEATLRKYGSLA